MINVVNFEEKDDQLIITLTDEGREELENLKKLPIMDALYELFEYYTCNGWTWVKPEEIGALTDSPIISNDFEYIDNDKQFDDTKKYYSVYWFPDYMIKSEIEELEKGELIFIKVKAE
jgi:hypothetical protein